MVWGRVRAAWAILRMRHPLLASRVVMRDYDDVRFVYVFAVFGMTADLIVRTPRFFCGAQLSSTFIPRTGPCGGWQSTRI